MQDELAVRRALRASTLAMAEVMDCIAAGDVDRLGELLEELESADRRLVESLYGVAL